MESASEHIESKTVYGVPESEYHYQEIAELKSSCKRLLEQLHDRIESGSYDLIIGDDASGRIPTLVMRDVIKRIYHERGRKIPHTAFVAGSRFIDEIRIPEKTKALAEHVRKIAEWHDESDRALVITDTIGMGLSLKPLFDALRENGIEYDIATTSLVHMPEMTDEARKMVERSMGGNLYYGEVGMPRIYGRHDIAGVKKNPIDLFATRHIEKRIQLPQYEKPVSKVRIARADAKKLASDLVDWYHERYSEDVA
jgi:hypothetical protein